MRVQYRQLRSQPTLIGIQVGLILLLTPAIIGHPPVYETLWSEPGAYFYGTQVSMANDGDVLEMARGTSGVVFLTVAYFVTFKMIASGQHLEGEAEAILSAAHPRTVAVADMLTLIAYSVRILGPPILIGAVSFGTGAGTLRPTITVIAACALLVVTAVPLVYTSILAFRLIANTVLQTDLKRSFVLIPFVILMFVIFLRFRESVSLLATLPISWYADIALLGYIEGASASNAILALCFVPGIVGSSILLGGRIGEHLWLTAGVQQPTPNRPSRNRLRGARQLERILPRPVVAAVVTNWMRIGRHPRVFLYGGLLLVLTGSAGITAMQEFPDSAPLIVAIYGAAAVGVGVTLNPLGNEGRTLKATLTTRRGGKILLTGYVLSIAIPGGLLVCLATLGTALLTELSVLTRAVLAALGLALGFLSPFISIGIGTALPKFDGPDPTGSTTGEIPRLEAVLVFLLSMIGIGLPAAFGLYDANASGEPSYMLLAGPIATVLLGSAIGWLSFRYSIAAIERLELST